MRRGTLSNISARTEANPPRFQDSVESEMARIERELRRNPKNSMPYAAESRYYDSLDVHQSPLAKALESQAPGRRSVPRPLPDTEGTDIFGVPSGAPTTQAQRLDSPAAQLRAQRKQQQEEYARQLAEASGRPPIGGLRREVEQDNSLYYPIRQSQVTYRENHDRDYNSPGRREPIESRNLSRIDAVSLEDLGRAGHRRTARPVDDHLNTYQPTIATSKGSYYSPSKIPQQLQTNSNLSMSPSR